MKLRSRKINKSVPLTIVATISVAALLMINGCKKPAETTYEAFNASNIRVVNGLPGRTGVKFYLDTINITMNSTLNYGTNSIYYVVKSGTKRAKLFSTSTSDTFAVRDVQLETRKNYSLFFAGSVGAPKYFLTEDDLVPPPTDKVKIRLANLAITGGNVDLTIQKIDLVNPQPEVTVLTNVASESISNYALATVPVSKGNATPQYHNIRLYAAGTANLVAQGLGIDLRGTAINTIIANGINGGSPAITVRASRDWLNW